MWVWFTQSLWKWYHLEAIYGFLFAFHSIYGRIFSHFENNQCQIMIWPWSLKLVPLESVGAVSYSPFIVSTASNYGIILYCLPDIASYWSKIAKIFYTAPACSAPERGGPVGISRSCLILVKLEWSGYRVVTKNNNMLSRFHGIPERDWRTDRQNCYINIARQCAIKINILIRLRAMENYYYIFLPV